MFRIKLTLGAALLACAAADAADRANTGVTAPVSEEAAAQAVCMYRAKLAYEVVNFRTKGGKRELFQLRFSDRIDPDLKAQTLAAVDLAFDTKGSAEEVAAFVYRDCTGIRI
jgi:hypothetical protein